LLDISTTS